MQKYGSKRDKALATKGWEAKKGLTVWEAERVMNIELFLEGQTKGEADSPNHLMMLYEMFWHAADQGQKEAKWTVQWGCLQELPKLDSEEDVSTVQLWASKLARSKSSPCTFKVKTAETTGVSTWRTWADGGGGVFL